MAENVAQRVDGIDTEKVWRCLDQAGLTEKVRSLPQGLDTHIGRQVFEDGVELSGGQTQRLMLARALYKDGPILALDEPTAALDPLAENDIYLKYNEMTRGRTSVFISTGWPPPGSATGFSSWTTASSPRRGPTRRCWPRAAATPISSRCKVSTIRKEAAKMEEKSKLTWRRTWQLTLRAWRIWWKRCPGYFAAVVLRDAIQALGPYVAIYLSARLINELAGSRDPQALLWWVGWQLGTLAFLTLAGGLCTHWVNYCEDTLYPLNRRIYIDKMLEMDYADLDRQAVYELYSKLMQSQNFIGLGVRGALERFSPLLQAVLQTFGGVALSISLFLLPVPTGSSLAFLNHWLAAPLTLFLLLLLTLSASASNSYSQSFFARYAKEGRAANRCSFFFCRTCQERSRALDMRLYRQQERVCSLYMKRNMDLGFGPGSKIAAGPEAP